VDFTAICLAFRVSTRGASEDTQQAWVEEARRRAQEVERGEGELIDLDEALTDVRSRWW